MHPSLRKTVVRELERAAPEPNTGCSLSLATLASGYPIVFRYYNPIDGQGVFQLSRLVYEYAHGAPAPDGFDVHHKCRSRTCINPDHLVALPRSEHATEHADARHAKHEETHGHEYRGAINNRGAPYCQECNRTNAKRSRERRRRAQLAG